MSPGGPGELYAIDPAWGDPPGARLERPVLVAQWLIQITH